MAPMSERKKIATACAISLLWLWATATPWLSTLPEARIVFYLAMVAPFIIATFILSLCVRYSIFWFACAMAAIAGGCAIEYANSVYSACWTSVLLMFSLIPVLLAAVGLTYRLWDLIDAGFIGWLIGIIWLITSPDNHQASGFGRGYSLLFGTAPISLLSISVLLIIIGKTYSRGPQDSDIPKSF